MQPGLSSHSGSLEAAPKHLSPSAEVFYLVESMRAATEMLNKVQVEQSGIANTLWQMQGKQSCLEERLGQLMAEYEQHVTMIINQALYRFLTEVRAKVDDSATLSQHLAPSVAAQASPPQPVGASSSPEGSAHTMDVPLGPPRDIAELDGILPKDASLHDAGKKRRESHESLVDPVHNHISTSKIAKVAAITVFDRSGMSNMRYSILRAVKSPTCDYLTTLLIMLNCVYMAVYTDWVVKNLREPDEGWVKGIDVLFTALFCIDLVLRIFAERMKFFFGPDQTWNILDFIVVASAIMEDVMKALVDYSLNGAKVLRILRILRLVRVVRVMRAMRFFSQLRVLVYGIMQSIISLFWAIVLLVAIIFGFSVYTTESVAYYFIDRADSASPDILLDNDIYDMLKNDFGSVLHTMYAHWMAITGGASWGEYAQALFEVSPACGSLFVFYIAFGVCAMLNVVTGAFVNKALKVAEGDQDLVILERHDDRKELIETVRSVFAKADADGSGGLDMTEFAKHMSDPSVHAYFRYLDLDLEGMDVSTLFEMLDFDNDGKIQVDEFVFGCSVMKGSARGLDLARFAHNTHRQVNDIMKLVKAVQMQQAQESLSLRGELRKVMHICETPFHPISPVSAVCTTPYHQQPEPDIQNPAAQRKMRLFNL